MDGGTVALSEGVERLETVGNARHIPLPELYLQIVYREMFVRTAVRVDDPEPDHRIGGDKVR